MKRAARAEWMRLWRPRTLVAFVGGAALASLLVVVVVFLGGGGSGNEGVSFTSTFGPDELSDPQGLADVFGAAGGTFLPLAALVLFAVSAGSEYRLHTLRTMLIALPQRGAYLVGKLLALAGLLAVAVTVAFLCSAAAAYALSPGTGVETGPWTSPDGLSNATAQVVNSYLMSLGWGLVGAAVAVAARSSAGAIGISLGYFLVVENLVVAAWRGADSWLPGRLFVAVGSGGTDQTGFAYAAASAACYAALAVGVATVLLVRRDVTE